MKVQSKIYLLFFTVLSMNILSCKKDNVINFAPASAEFASPVPLGQYFIKNDPNSVFKIPVGITNVSNVPRTVTFTVTSPTGATQGQQYTLASNSVVIPAGTAVDSISLKGIFAGYPSGRKDTLVFTITGGDPIVFKGYETYKVVLQKYCDVIGSQIIGNYTNTMDYGPGPSAQGAYTSKIANWVSTGATTAKANIINLGATSDMGWGPFGPTDPVTNPGIVATFDWTNPAAFKVTIASQNYFNDGSGWSLISTATGTFSSCDNTITLPTITKYAGNGSSYLTTTILKR